MVQATKTGSGSASIGKQGNRNARTKAIGPGNIIYADGLFYCYSDRGELALVDAKPEGFNCDQ